MSASDSNSSLVDLRPFLPPGELADEFEVTIKARRRKPDARRLVKDPIELKKFVDAIVARNIASLSPLQRSFGSAILGSLVVKPTPNSVMEAIARYRGSIDHAWVGVKGGALKDNYYRPSKGPRGQSPRTKRAQQTVLDHCE